LRSDVVLDRGIMVLLEKHVHLQKDVGAARMLTQATERAMVAMVALTGC
jgi:hypothetical protein